MNRTIERAKRIFLVIFAVTAAGVGVWQFGWVVPRKKCEAQQKWWDDAQRVCAQPVLISDITGRVITDAKAKAEAEKAVGRKPKP